jgi:hypothetical protein
MILAYAIIGLIIGLPLILAGGVAGAVIGFAWGCTPSQTGDGTLVQ